MAPRALMCVAVALSISLQIVRDRRLIRAFRRWLPIVVFAGGVYLLRCVSARSLATGDGALLAIRILFVYAVATWLGLALWLGDMTPPRGRLMFRAFLFACFTRHFAIVLTNECHNSLRARKLAAPSLWSKSGMSSLVYSCVNIFTRTLLRAERFYAAQLLKGLDA